MTKSVPELRGIEGLLRRLWSRVKEPRVLSILSWTVHVALGVTGAMTLVILPAALGGTAGPIAAPITSGLLILGGLLGSIGALPGWQFTERLGIVSSTLGIVLYGLVLIYIKLTVADTSLSPIPITLSYVALVWLASRWIRIKDHVFEPGSKAEARAIRDNPSIRADTGSIPTITEP